MAAWRGVGLVATMAFACAGDPPTLPPSAEGDAASGGSAADDDGSASADDGAPTTGTTAAPAGDGSETVGSSADPTGGPDTGTDAGSSICGDGIAQPGEPCDDANASEIDGCLSSCEVGPVAVAPTGDPVTTPLVGFGAPNQAVDDFADCPDGHAMVGIDASNIKVLGGFVGWCAPLDLVDADPTSVVVGVGEQIEALGFPGDQFGIGCPEGELFAELSLGGSAGTIGGFAGTCRVPQIVGTGPDQIVALAPGSALEPDGFVDPTEATTCPPGMVATGLHARISAQFQIVVELGLRCRTLALVLPR